MGFPQGQGLSEAIFGGSSRPNNGSLNRRAPRPVARDFLRPIESRGTGPSPCKFQPDGVAFVYLVDGENEQIEMTYGELDRQARAIGAWWNRWTW